VVAAGPAAGGAPAQPGGRVWGPDLRRGRRYGGTVDEREGERVEIDGVELRVDPADDDGTGGGLHNALPPRIESWRRRSATGAILTGFALGLKQVLEPQRDEPAIVMQVSGEPVRDLAVDAQLNDLQPSESVVTVRPWLLAGYQPGDAGEDARPGTPDGNGTASPTPPSDRDGSGGPSQPEGPGGPVDGPRP
jgi:hypothetical protein